MIDSRRHFLKLAGVATAYGAVGRAAGQIALAAEDPALGLIFPPLNYPIPPDAKLLYPTGVQFLGDGVGLPGGMTPAGYDEAIPRVLPAAQALAKRGAKVISVFGSSLTFYKGAKFNEELVSQVTQGDRPAGDHAEQRSGGRPAHRQRQARGGRHRLYGCRDRASEGLPRRAWVRGDVRQGPGLRADSGRARPVTTSCSSSGWMPTRIPARLTRWSCLAEP